MRNIKILLGAFLFIVSLNAISGVSVYESLNIKMPSPLYMSDNDITKNDVNSAQNTKRTAYDYSLLEQPSVLVAAHIKKPLREIIRAYFPTRTINNISSNKNILETIVTIIPSKDVEIDKEDVLNKIMVSINLHLNNELDFKIRSTEIFIIDKSL